MKIFFLESKYKKEVNLPKDIIDQLPEKIALGTTVQYLDKMDKVISQLEASGKKVILLQGEHSKYKGQILGCDINQNIVKNLNEQNLEYDCFLFVGDGVFHPKVMHYFINDDNKKIFAFNPKSNDFSKIAESDIQTIKKRTKGALLKYLTSKNIGILVSTKPGQQRFKKSLELKEMIEGQEKNAFIMLNETLDFTELENFPFIDCFVNTMCPRIGYDDIIKFPKPVINFEDIEEYYESIKEE